MLAMLGPLAEAIVRSMLLLAGFVANSGTFPQPLSEEEEAKYLSRLQNGDEEARAVLIERNLRLVAHIVKKFDNTGEDVDDLISIGTVGLIKAIGTFKPERGTRLATYAARCIENEILMHLRSLKRVRGEVSLYDPIGVDREGNEITLIDVLGSDPDVVPDLVGKRLDESKLREKLKKLGGKERQVLELRYGIAGGPRKTQREIARMLGISRSYVSRIEKKAVMKLCRELFEEGYGN
ncbi:RNA polymerase sigma factor similar to B. subtilis SigK [Symbiobacterium thermophilum IAM 14863]|uniref:RNA polymerase sigma factor n=5 Tax=Symbiobacterium thermophilum TaxID=2734 RepID=Q67N00_SYMTH|nr:RNA polymerase sigma factor similar to B. subtilis SigK [Symbiobacterium thermophilum IAM 14863]